MRVLELHAYKTGGARVPLASVLFFCLSISLGDDWEAGGRVLHFRAGRRMALRTIVGWEQDVWLYQWRDKYIDYTHTPIKKLHPHHGHLYQHKRVACQRVASERASENSWWPSNNCAWQCLNICGNTFTRTKSNAIQFQLLKLVNSNYNDKASFDKKPPT